MEKFFRYGLNPQAIPGYNCSRLNENSTAMPYTEGIIKYVMGFGLITYGICTQIIYVMVMWSMYGLVNRNSCYRIMLTLGVFDFFILLIASDITGYFWLTKTNYCTQPVLNYVAGSSVLGLWCAVCLTCLILVVNRLVDLWNTNIHRKIFSRNVTLYWLILPILYYLYFSFCTYPVLFNSLFNAWMFSPFIEGTPEEMAKFVNIPHTINNCVVVVITCLLYVVLIILWKKKYSSYTNSTTAHKTQRSITIQCVAICSASFAASIMYVYMNIFEVPIFFIPASHIIWQLSHGIPAFIYLIMNHTIRAEILKRFRIRISVNVSFGQQYSVNDGADRATATASTTPNTRNSVNQIQSEEFLRV